MKPIKRYLALAVIAAGFFGSACQRSGSDGAWSDEQLQVRDALEKAGGDPQKLPPDMKQRYDKIIKENPYTSARARGSQSPQTKDPK